jgi:hypothetical protein
MTVFLQGNRDARSVLKAKKTGAVLQAVRLKDFFFEAGSRMGPQTWECFAAAGPAQADSEQGV